MGATNTSERMYPKSIQSSMSSVNFQTERANSTFSLSKDVILKLEKIKKDINSNKSNQSKNFDPYYEFLSNYLLKNITISKKIISDIKFSNCPKDLQSANKSQNGNFNENNKLKGNPKIMSNFQLRNQGHKKKTDIKYRSNMKDYRNLSKNQIKIDVNKNVIRNSNSNKNTNSIFTTIETPYYNNIKIDIFCLLPFEIISKIVNFLIEDFHRLICVSPYWRVSILQSLDYLFSKCENEASQLLINFLLFKNSYIEFKTIKFENTKYLRIDRVFVFEVDSRLINTTLNMGFTYKYYNDTNHYKTEYTFDIVKNGPRILWMHRGKTYVKLI